MKIIKTIEELRSELGPYRQQRKTIGFVPTMGFFHEGHLTLMDRAKAESDVLVVSLYVNPTQFGPNEDLSVYPRDFERDEKMARERGVDILFYPDNSEMYPVGYKTFVYTKDLAKKLCGKSRENHFEGVTTIVTKLFNIVQPQVAVFGQKDHQQAIILQRIVTDLNIPVKIIVAPIVRENDGLAMSSRNQYLSSWEREQAVVLFQSLQKARESVRQGETSVTKIRNQIIAQISRSPLADIEYVEIVNPIDLERIAAITPGTFAALAVRFGKTRLIDNMVLAE